jgi:hypothetical protein
MSAKKTATIGAKPTAPFPKKEGKPTKKGSITQAPDKPRGSTAAKLKEKEARKRETTELFTDKPRKAPAKKKEALAEEASVPPSDLKRIVKMVGNLVDVKEKRVAAEDIVAELRKKELELERESVPTLMAEIGINQLRLSSGQTVSIAQDCEAKIPEEQKPKAFAWLIKNGFGGLIKTAVSVEFGKGEHDAAEKVKTTISRMFPANEVALAETVHPQTLKSFVKERHEKGEPVPATLFGVFMFKKAVIKE